MKYRKFGRIGFEVSDIAHGLWGMGGWSGSEDSESLKALQLAIDLGCNFFDTAWAYGDGKSDGLLGETIAKNPDKRLFAASKSRRRTSAGRLRRNISTATSFRPTMSSPMLI